MGAAVQFTKESLDAYIKEAAGAIRAEMRAENEALVKEIEGKRKNPLTAILANVRPAGKSDQAPKQGALLPRLLMAVAGAGGDSEKAAVYAEKRWGKDVEGMEPVMKSLLAGDFSGAGALIDEAVSADFIDLLLPATCVRGLGASIEPMPGGSTAIRKQTSGSTATYVGEVQGPNASKPAYGQLRLVAKTLVAKIAVSNKAISAASDLTGRVQRDAVNQIRVREDKAFIRDVGTAFTPKGLRYWAPSGNVIPANGTVNLANVTVDLGKLTLALQNANVPFVNPGWIMPPRLSNYLMTLQTSNGEYAFRAEMNMGKLWGYPFKTTTQIPTNLGGGTNESELYFADFSEVVVGDTGRIKVAVSQDAAYADESGNLVSAFDNDETVFRLQMEHDLVVRHAEAVAILTAVTWGA